MSLQRTLSIIKPEAVKKNLIGKILSRFEEGGLQIIACRMLTLTEDQARQFYAVHKEKPFYGELVQYMTSGRVLVSVLEGEDAIQRNRQIMGATDPKKADAGTIRADYAESIQFNAVHGSDAPETAKVEIGFFFPELR